jgi:hypothetical protein
MPVLIVRFMACLLDRNLHPDCTVEHATPPRVLLSGNRADSSP